MNKRIGYILIIVILIFAKLWIGLYDHDEFDEKHLFIKHRPIWKTHFYSPRGMSDMKLSEMSEEAKREQKLFDEFIIDNQVIQ
ncbi:hypothetical protein SAMN04489796_1011047 [Winogradskyella thalassocola]|uniref:Uncharacterized protein n=1 Tax=Winogradskyella thalassocola TaxID=262004 RepID=A0A1G7YJD9_9FLAO|nr:hypothetical protein SAMN04489796_1011047 [Winogradskyella thalassocola]